MSSRVMTGVAAAGDHNPAVLGEASDLLVAQTSTNRSDAPARPFGHADGPPSGLASYGGTVEFSRELRPAVLSGEITVSFRLWRQPKVKIGGRYRVGGGQIEVDAIELVPFSAIDEADLRRSGEGDREALRRRAAHAGTVGDDTLVYRIEFHVVE